MEQANRGASRVRDNQRRSRAKQKEYLQELESKMRGCERLGVQASLEIQAAARSVLEENKRLRALLSSRGNDERAGSHDQHGNMSPEAVLLQQKLERRRLCDLGKVVDNSGQTSPNLRQDSRLAIQEIETSPMNCTSYSSSTSKNLDEGTGISPLIISAISPLQPNELSSIHPQMQQSLDLSDPDLCEDVKIADTSLCAFAIDIITNMCADVTPTEIRIALGCGDDLTECKVDNSRLFSTVDQYAG